MHYILFIPFPLFPVYPISYHWLVVSTPLKNMKVSWVYYSQYMEKLKKCSKLATSDGNDISNPQKKGGNLPVKGLGLRKMGSYFCKSTKIRMG
jgi:hypothetical protein